MRLNNLLKLTREKSTHSKVQMVARGLGVIIGTYSSFLFLSSNQRFVAGYNKFWQYLITGSSISINAIVNSYFNVIAADDISDFWDPVNKKLLISKTRLGIIIFFSVTSACSFALLDLDSTGIKFALQIATYSTQHFFFLNDLSQTIFSKKPKEQAEKEFFAENEKLKDKIEKSITALYQSFDNENLIQQFILENDQINLDEIESFIEQQEIKITGKDAEQKESTHAKPKTNCQWRQTPYYTSQAVGGFITAIGNLCFYNSAINEFPDVEFLHLTEIPSAVTWGVAGLCMIPVLGMAFILTKRTIDQVFAMVKEGINGDSIPYFIRKNIKISLVVGIPMTIFAFFSYGPTYRLTQESIYPIWDGNPPNFGWLDPFHGKLKGFYSYSTAIATIIFNIFPVGTVVDAFVKNCKYYFGSPVEKQQIKVLNFFNALRNRVGKATFETVSVSPATAINSLEEPLLAQPQSSLMRSCGQTIWAACFGKKLNNEPFYDSDEERMIAVNQS
ncbi:MAG: hypothetical protein JSR33_02890 [Proteobacteria bacterium]|nr:hypothetical protein [Pseudomonadota bacterium]